MRKFLLGLAVAAAIAVTWRHYSVPVAPVGANPPQAKADTLPMTTVLRVRPDGAMPAAPAGGAGVTRRVESADLAQYRSRRDYAALYARVSREAGAGEAGYIAAEIYYRCARHDDTASGAPDAAAARAQFQATIARAGSQADTRAAAYARLDGSSACAGLDFGAYDAKAYAEMLRASADAGYAAASARLLADRIVRDTNVAQQSANHGSGYSVSPDTLAQMTALLASGDPDVIQSLSGILASTIAGGVVQLAGEDVEAFPMHAAMTLLACDAGADCGGDARPILMACAYHGQCDAHNVEDFVYYYDMSPAQAQLVNNYRQTLRGMLGAHDFSGVTLVPTTGSSPYTYMFGGRDSGP
ncbi:MAG TPA: hypothetical protein VGR63_08175 [Casimicrobiaceae bacterium]|nr:hypothetical protein [Casimicrobiaceae bacterium]